MGLISRLCLGAFAISTIVACTLDVESPAPEGEPAQPASSDTPSAKPIPKDPAAPGEKLSPEEVRACEAEGGSVERAGMAGWQRCIKPMPDAGMACQSSSECAGKCLVDRKAPTPTTSGKCAATDNPFGCYARFEDGKPGAMLCVD